MSQDRFVYFSENKCPRKDELEILVEDYFSGIGSIEWLEDQSRWYITLPGNVRKAYARLGSETIQKLAEEELKNPRPRFIEIFLEENHYVDVITRSQDAITNVIANGFQMAVMNFWGGSE